MMDAPAFYDDLEATCAHALSLLARGVADRRAPFHHPCVATIGLDGRPRNRTVILRGFDAAQRQLRFHTDARAEKIEELTRDARIALHFYDPGAKIQLRIEGEASVHREDTIADAAWAASRVFSRQCYGIAPGPGTPLSAGRDFTLPETSEEATAAGRAQFCAVVTRIATLEWLYLAAQGHRRARFAWGSEGMTAQWLAP